MVLRRHCFWKNKNAVTVPVEALIAFGIMIITIAFLLANINNFFIPYEKTGSDLNYKIIDVCESLIKNTGQTTYGSPNWEDDPDNISVLGLAVSSTAYDFPITQIGYSSVGATYYQESDQNYLYPSRRHVPDPQSGYRTTMFHTVYNFPSKQYYDFMMDKTRHVYAVLDWDKIEALRNNNVSYETAKRVLGLDPWYDFNLTITKITISDVIKTEVVLEYGRPYYNAEVVVHYPRNVIIFPDTPAKLQVYMFL